VLGWDYELYEWVAGSLGSLHRGRRWVMVFTCGFWDDIAFVIRMHEICP
jgi:hypothetical protein